MAVGGLLVCLGSGGASAQASGEAPSTREADGAPSLGVVIPQDSVDVSPRFDSRLERLEVEVGQAVQAGQVLARLDTRSLRQGLAAAEAALQGARAEEQAARIVLSTAREKRGRYLAPRSLELGVYSREELDGVHAEESTARARLWAAQAHTLEREAQASELRQNLEEATLVAPFAGVVASKLGSPGARLAAGQPVLRLLGTGGWKVRFAVSEGATRAFHPGASVEVKVARGGLTLAGVVESLSPEVDAAARLVFATATFNRPPPSEVSSGLVVHVRPVTAQAAAEAPRQP